RGVPGRLRRGGLHGRGAEARVHAAGGVVPGTEAGGGPGRAAPGADRSATGADTGGAAVPSVRRSVLRRVVAGAERVRGRASHRAVAAGVGERVRAVRAPPGAASPTGRGGGAARGGAARV